MGRRKGPTQEAHLRKGASYVYAATFFCFALAAQAQEPAPAPGTPSQGISRKSKRQRSKVARPADFFGAGLLQLEYGYDGDFRSGDAERDQAGTASVLFNATEDVQFELDVDTFHNLTTSSAQTATGFGDAYLTVQVTTFAEGSRHPSLAFGYLVKAPTASENRGLGTGRTDHKLTLLTSKKMHGTDVDFNASLLVNGSPDTSGWDAGYQLAVGLSRDIRRRVSLRGEIFGETLDTDQPRGLFVQGRLAYEPTARIAFDVGLRAGLSSGAPRFGLFGGVSFDLANFCGR
jgi:hypothetical protein